MNFSKDIYNIQTLKDNWNGYNAKAISQVVIDRALELDVMLDCCDYVVPTPKGTIQFEYRCDSKYFEVEVTKNKYELMLVESFIHNNVKDDYENVKYYTVFKKDYVPMILHNFLNK